MSSPTTIFRRVVVSVPSRGIGCIANYRSEDGEVYVSVPSRGIGCIIASMMSRVLLAAVSVPSRGIGCIRGIAINYLTPIGFRPLTGHRMHSVSNPIKFYVLLVSVPSRGIGCIGKDIHHKIDNRQCFYEKCRRKISIMSDLPIHLI